MTYPISSSNGGTRINPVAGWATRQGDGTPVALEIKYVNLESDKMTGLGRLFSIGLTPDLCRLLAQDLLDAANGDVGKVYPPQ